MLLKEEGDTEELFHGRRLRKSLNIPLLKRWICTCSDRCRSEGDLQSPSATASPARVIDTRRLMIQQTPPNCDYAALSYTWGPENITQLELTKDNEPQLTKPGGLKGVRREIPRTIRHAIWLCRKLGINYLWVDALCRGKGDGYEGEKEIKDIPLIFAKACLTIVGNGRNSHRGLKGVESSHSPYRHQISRLVGHLSLAVSKPLIDQSMKNSGWKKRLWPFEEWFVSRRLLILADHQAFFCCKAKRMIYSEDTCSEVMGDSGPVISIDNLPQIDHFWSCHEGWDGGFDVYAAHAEEYANRYVTNEDDLSSGFDMVKRSLENKLGPQFHYNLPVEFFAQALCFAILSGRRRSSSKFPSWSWQGWNVSGQSVQPGYSGLYYESRWGFKPLGPPATYFYTSKSSGLGSFQFESIYDRLRTGHEAVSPLFSDHEPPCPAIIEELPDALKEHLVAFSALTVELFTYKSDDDNGDWVVAVQDGGQANEKVGSAILNLADDQTNKGYFKFVLIGFCCPHIDGEYNEFLLVVSPSGYENVFCRVGCCLSLGKFRGRTKREMVYLI
ncbi:hypothetical protein CFD26_103473 [Aspergillus turcosus]|uniref:Heterokaryon incompatibility domain-containing protein n=1 Tax=Aspergillus turcosus TaxID=1245748 RepID=A0A3R7III2_9EURO|nr:hypothetical protein CFD26_103473 [Aspergillus turcosus]